MKSNSFLFLLIFLFMAGLMQVNTAQERFYPEEHSAVYMYTQLTSGRFHLGFKIKSVVSRDFSLYLDSVVFPFKANSLFLGLQFNDLGYVRQVRGVKKRKNKVFFDFYQ